MRCVAAALLLLCGVAAAPAPLVLCPLKLQLAQAPWAVAALDFPAGADVTLALRPAVGAGAAVAAGRGTADAGGKAAISLALSGSPPPPGLYTLRAVSTAAAWQQSANVTLVGRAPLVVSASPFSQAQTCTHDADSCLRRLLQTIVLDKALYKPGETVLIRALALATDLLPIAGAQVRTTPKPAFGPTQPCARAHALRRAPRVSRRDLRVRAPLRAFRLVWPRACFLKLLAGVASGGCAEPAGPCAGVAERARPERLRRRRDERNE